MPVGRIYLPILILPGLAVCVWSVWMLALGVFELRRARRPEDRNICPHCGYDIGTLQTSRCPECGLEATEMQWDVWRAENARGVELAQRHLRMAVTFGVLGIMGMICGGLFADIML